MNAPESVHIPSITLESFESFRAAHGPLESPLAQNILETFFGRVINEAFENKRMGAGGFFGIADHVSKTIARNAPDLLAVLELAAEWSADPLKAAEAQLRPAMEAKAKAEAEELKRRKEAQLRAEVQKRTDALLASLPALDAPAAGKGTEKAKV